MVRCGPRLAALFAGNGTLRQIRTMFEEMNQTSYHLEPASSSTSSVVTFPKELSFRSLDQETGCVSSTAIYRMMIHGRVISLYRQPDPYCFIDYQRLKSKHLCFVVSGSVSIPGLVYNTSIPKFPVEVESKLVTFRKSSFVLETSMAISSIARRAVLRTSLVLVDKETRRPRELPEWWRGKYEGFSEKMNVQYLRSFECPSKLICRGMETRRFTVSVTRRDHDHYNHVNVVCYMGYCIDALEYHLYTNRIDCDINTVSLLLKTAQFSHLDESVVGDILTVAFWDDETDPETVRFDIKKSGKSIYQAKMQFYGKRLVGTASSNL